MNKNHNEAIAGANAFQAFAKEFGPDDVYTRIILEILLEELLSPSYKLVTKYHEEKKDGSKIN